MKPRPESDFRAAAVVFTGKVTNLVVNGSRTEVTFEVYEAWKGRPGRSVTVKTSSSGAGCGYVPDLGDDYLILAHAGKVPGELWIGLCGTNQPLACAEARIRLFGNPETSYAPSPSFAGWGEDEDPIPEYIIAVCGEPPKLLQHETGLPCDVQVRDYNATILRDGTVRVHDIQLECSWRIATLCTPEFTGFAKARLERLTYRPARLGGREVAMKSSRVWYPELRRVRPN